MDLDDIIGKIVLDVDHYGEGVEIKFNDGTVLIIEWWANDMHDGGGVVWEMSVEA